MDAVREQAKNPIVVGVLAFFIGVIFGLVVLGWWLWPVEWTDAAPEDLIAEEQTEYLRMSIEAYGYTGDAARAQSRFVKLGEDTEVAMEGIISNPEDMDAKLLVDFNAAVDAPPAELALDQTAAPGSVEELVAEELGLEAPAVEDEDATETTAEEQPDGEVPEEDPLAGELPSGEFEAEDSGSKSLLGTIWPVLCLVVMVVVAAAVALFIIRSRGTSEPQSDPPPDKDVAVSHEAQSDVPWEEFTEPAVEGELAPPLGQFMTSYQHGDDMYDDSFSIDSPSGEFLGECGVGISETVGVGDPKRVTAFEVWLFDKNDIQTVTKVLMSAHAFSDSELQQQLAARGEPVLVELGGETMLETQTLQLVARIVDIAYGDGTMPADSFFDRFILELEVSQKA
jgi:hypothetical protein